MANQICFNVHRGGEKDQVVERGDETIQDHPPFSASLQADDL
jgi:hypothetical protein